MPDISVIINNDLEQRIKRRLLSINNSDSSSRTESESDNENDNDNGNGSGRGTTRVNKNKSQTNLCFANSFIKFNKVYKVIYLNNIISLFLDSEHFKYIYLINLKQFNVIVMNFDEYVVVNSIIMDLFGRLLKTNDKIIMSNPKSQNQINKNNDLINRILRIKV